MIAVEALGFRHVGRRRPTLHNISFTLTAGETMLVLGPSGGGKSTLALCLAGAIPHLIQGEFTGRVQIGGGDSRTLSMAELAQRVGIVFQDPEAQFCMLNVEDEIAFGLENLAVPRSAMDGQIEAALAAVGLSDKRRSPIAWLSGGQKQRLALAAVLVQRPALLVLDEPTAQLDPVGAAEVIALLGRLRSEGRYSIVLIEHRLDDVMALVDRLLVLDSQGTMVALGEPRTVIAEHGAWLAEAGVWVPQVAELALALAQHGRPITPLPITVDEAAATLLPWATELTRPNSMMPAITEQASPLAGEELRPDMMARRADWPIDAPALLSATTHVPQREPLLSVRGLTAGYPGSARPVLKAIKFSLYPGEFVAIVGANGAGKSTLAHLLVGIRPAPAGSIFLAGDDLSRLRRAAIARRIGYVFQYPEHQFIGQSLLADIAFGLLQRGLSELEATTRARAILEDFGLAALAPVHPFTLSHGEQRRLSVAAMLVLDQALLLLDEPTFGQDRRNAMLLADKLAALVAAGRTVVTITHDMRLVAERAERVLVLADGQLRFDGSPERLFANPALLAQAHLAPPPLWELSGRLGLGRPLRDVADAIGRLSRPIALAEQGGPGSARGVRQEVDDWADVSIDHGDRDGLPGAPPGARLRE